MNNSIKLLSAKYLVKQAYADYLGMGRQGMLTMGGRGGIAPAGMGLSTHNLGDNTSNLSRYSFTDGTPKASPAMGAGDTSFPNAVGERSQFNEFQNTLAAAKQRGVAGMAKHRAQQAAPKNDMNALFKKYMGTAFDPNSRLDKAKMKYLQGLSDKGVTLNAANIYDKGQGYGKW